MAKKKQVRRKKFREIPTPESCHFCDKESDPSIKEYKELTNFITERGKIFSKDRSGFCAKHQRQFALMVKQARYLGLLPYVPAV